MKSFEANFDGLVGPTHNYAGLSYGNVASMSHKAMVSNPREAVLQGLKKMKALADKGFTQGVLAPQERPDLKVLRRLGFDGTDENVLKSALEHSPAILASCYSASSMWTANAATISPSADSTDGKVHFTAANLNNKFHRSIEHETTSNILKAMFKDESVFVHHESLPRTPAFGDEGAANHTRFCEDYGHAGLQFFVYGQIAFDTTAQAPKKFPARQTLEASKAIARLHKLKDEQCVFAQQNPAAIDAGAFHNDVVSVGNKNVLFYHEDAFLASEDTIGELGRKFSKLSKIPFRPVLVPTKKVPLADAVKSYLFNSQLLSLPNGNMCLVAPQECQETESVRLYTEELVKSPESPIKDILYFDLRQSMQNGGGPACLRLRVALNENEIAKTNKKVLMNDALYSELTTWANKHYRDRLAIADLADPKLVIESRTALDELTKILNLGSVYSFQRDREAKR